MLLLNIPIEEVSSSPMEEVTAPRPEDGAEEPSSRGEVCSVVGEMALKIGRIESSHCGRGDGEPELGVE